MKKSVAAVVTTLICWLPVVAANSLLYRRDWFAGFYSLLGISLALAIVQIIRQSPMAMVTLRVGACLALLVFSPLILVMILGHDENPAPAYDLSFLRGHLLLVVVYGLCMVALSRLEPLHKYLGQGARAH